MHVPRLVHAASVTEVAALPLSVTVKHVFHARRLHTAMGCLLTARPPRPRSIPAIAVKMVLDQAFMAPFGCALFYSVQGVLSGAPATVVPTLREKFVPTLAVTSIASFLFWRLLGEAASSFPQAADLYMQIMPACALWHCCAVCHAYVFRIVACTLHMRRGDISVSAMQHFRFNVIWKLTAGLPPQASYKLWPAANIVNFALIPSSYRVLYTNLVSVNPSSLSLISHESPLYFPM